MSPEDREKILNSIRDKKTVATDYTDVDYQTLEVKVCKVFIRDEQNPIIVPEDIGIIIDEKTRSLDSKSEMIPIGRKRIRAYLVEKLEFGEERFIYLEKWAKRHILKTNPQLFNGQESKFSPGLKKQIQQILEEGE